MGEGAVRSVQREENTFLPSASTQNAHLGALRKGALSKSQMKPPYALLKPLPRMMPSTFFPSRTWGVRSYSSYTRKWSGLPI